MTKDELPGIEYIHSDKYNDPFLIYIHMLVDVPEMGIGVPLDCYTSCYKDPNSQLQIGKREHIRVFFCFFFTTILFITLLLKKKKHIRYWLL
jgi:hypothetical protein